MAKNLKGAPAPAERARRRPRWPVWGAGCAVLCAAALALVPFGGASDSTASLPGLGTLPCTPGSGRTVVCPHNKPFAAQPYTVHGDAFDCINFASQADAQAVLKADPADPDRLDPQRDGVACRELPAPKDLTPVKAVLSTFRCPAIGTRSERTRALGTDMRSALCPQPRRRFDPGFFVRFGGDAYNCPTFASQADAQAVLRYAPDDPNDLDGDGDGIACPDLPAPKDLRAITRHPPA